MDIELLFLFVGVLGTVVFVVFMVRNSKGVKESAPDNSELDIKPLTADMELLKTRVTENEKKIAEFKVALDLEPPIKESKDNLRVLGERLDKVEEIVTKLAPKETEQEPTREKEVEKQGEFKE